MIEADVRTRAGNLALDVSMAVGAECVAVAGPNGAGKTTLLRCLAGLHRITDGSIRLGGRVVDDPAHRTFVPAEQRNAGVVFQDDRLFASMTLVDNVAFGLRARGVRRGHARTAAAEWLARVGLEGREHDRPSGLSGGEARRVALARSLAAGPSVLLLDEPLAGVDVESRAALTRMLRSHLDGFEGPALVVTHDPVEAAAVARRIVVIESGRVTHDGTIDDITRRPKSAWTAELCGVNFYRGLASGGAVVLDGGGELWAADPGSGEVFVAIPPTAVAVYRSAPSGSPRNVWPGRVDEIAAFGQHVRLHISGRPDVTAEITPAAVDRLGLRPGDEVFVSVKASEIRTYPR